MTDCEFIKLCEEAFGATVPGCKNDHWRGCPNYDLCIRVHNKALEEGKKQLFNADSRADAIHKLEALKIKESP